MDQLLVSSTFIVVLLCFWNWAKLCFESALSCTISVIVPINLIFVCIMINTKPNTEFIRFTEIYTLLGLSPIFTLATSYLKMSWSKFDVVYLTLSYFRTYIYVQNPKTVATPVRIYTYRLAIEIWAFYWRLTDLYSITSRGVHVLPVCCCHYIRCLLVGGKVQFNRSCLLFFVSFGKLRMSDQVQFIAWHGIQRRIIWIFCRESEVSG